MHFIHGRDGVVAVNERGLLRVDESAPPSLHCRCEQLSIDYTDHRFFLPEHEQQVHQLHRQEGVLVHPV